MSTIIFELTEMLEAAGVSLLFWYYVGITGDVPKRRGRPKSRRAQLRPTSIKLEEDLKQRIQKIAEAEQRSMAAQIVYWILEKLRETDEEGRPKAS